MAITLHRSFSIWLALFSGLAFQLAATPAAAQVIGTFTWRVAPYCNLITVTVTVDGAAIRLAGFDDNCGAVPRIPVSGTVSPNPNGTFTFAFHLVAPSGQAQHATAVLIPGSYSGPWTDSSGGIGTLLFNPGGSSGSPRPLPSIPGDALADGSVTGAKIADGSITAADLAPGVVSGVADGSITTAKLADSAVTGVKIADGTITLADLAAGVISPAVPPDGSVTTPKLADGAVTSSKVADGSITLADLAPGTVASSALADGSVTLAKLAANAVNSSKIVDGAVAGVDLADAAVTAAKMAGNAVSSATIIDGAIATADLANDAVTGDKILFPIDETIATTFASDYALRLTNTVGSALYVRGNFGSAITAEMTGSGESIFGSLGTNAAFGSSAVVGRIQGQGNGVRGFVSQNPDSVAIGVLGEVISGATGYAGKFVNGSATNTFDNGTIQGVSVLQVESASSVDLIRAWTTGPSNLRFRVTSAGNAFVDGSFTGGGADVAEFIDAPSGLGPGDVVEIDPEDDGRFRLAATPSSTSVAGVLTTNPGLLMNSNEERQTLADGPALALAGRVPVKVSAENGPIARGDLLVASATPGHAMRAPANPAAGTVIGKALGRLSSGTGLLEMLVMLR